MLRPSVHEPPANANQIFDEWLSRQDAPIAPPEVGGLERLVTGITTAIPRGIEGLSMSAATLGRLTGMLPETETGQFLPHELDYAPGVTTGQKAADLAAGLMPLLPEFAVTGGIGRGVGALARVAKAVPYGPLTRGTALAGRIGQEALNFGVLGLQHEGLTGLEQAGEGAAIGAITGTLAKTDPRRWLAAAALGLGSKAFFDRNGPTPTPFGDWTQGDIAGTANVISTILIGKPMMGTHTTKVPTPGKFHKPDAPEAIPTKVREAQEYQDLMGVPPAAEAATPGAYPHGPASISYADVLGYGPAEREIANQLQQATNDNPALDFMLGIRSAHKSATASAELMMRQRAAANRNVELEFFREQRVLPARYTPPEMRAGARPVTEVPVEVLPPTGPNALAVTGRNVNFQDLFDPAQLESIRQAGVDIASPEAQSALQRLQLAMMTSEFRNNRQAQRVAFAQFFEQLQGQRPELGFPAWQEMVEQGTARPGQQGIMLAPDPAADMLINPLAGAHPVTPLQSAPTSAADLIAIESGARSPEQIQAAIGMRRAAEADQAAIIAQRERDTAARGKLDFSPIKPWMMPMQSGLPGNLVAQAAVGAGVGKLVAGQTADPNDEASMMLYFAGLGVSPQLAKVAIAGAQRLRSAVGRPRPFSEAGSIPAGAGPGDSNIGANLLRKIDEGKVIYDGEGTIMPNTHQFTIEDPTLAAHGQTFYVRGEVTPESFAKAYNDTVARYQPSKPAQGWNTESGAIAGPGGKKPNKIVESGLSPEGTKLATFAKTFQERIRARADEAYLDSVPTGMKKGDTFYSTSGRPYEFLSDGGIGNSKNPKYQGPMLYYRNPFDGSEGSMMHWGVDWEKTGVAKPTKTVREIQAEFRGEPPVATVAKPLDAEPPKMWHVTSEGNWKKIDKQGLRPLQTSNFRQGSATGARYGGGEIYAFDNFDDAVRWAAKMDWDATSSWGSGKFRIVEFGKKGEHWMVDTADPLTQSSAKGKWWKQMAGIKREEITNSYVFDDALASRMREKEIPAPGGMKRGASPEGGFVMPEMTAALGRGAIGGMLGGTIGGLTDDMDSNGNMILYGTMGAAAFMFGPAMARSLVAHLSGTRVKPASNPKAIDWTNLRAVLAQTIEEKAGAVISRASSKISDRAVRWLDSATEFTLPIAVKRALQEAKGAASVLLDNMDSAMLQVALRYKPEKAVTDIATQFLDGNINKTAFLQQLQPHILKDAQVRNYADLMVAGRVAVDGLQKMVLDGIGNPKMAGIINQSIGKYLTRSYRVFTNPHWRPSEASMQLVADEIVTKNLMGGAPRDSVLAALRQYVDEIKTAKGAYNISNFAQGAVISQQVLKQRQALSKEWRDFLGEITDPTERVYQTVFRLRPMAEASKYFADVAKVQDQGLPQVFKSYADMDVTRSQLKQKLLNPSISPSERELITQQLTRLDSYRNVDSHPKFGALGGNVVSRHVWDTLKTYDSMTDPTNHPFLRGIAHTHTQIKLMRTAFNPLTVVRNFMSMPVFMAIGRVNIKDIPEAWAIMKDPNHPLREEIMRQGIGNVDQVKTEFFKEFDNLTGSKYNFGEIDMTNLGMGKIDLDIAERVSRRGIRNILDVYRMPDNAVRIAAYISAKRRIAQDMGLGMDDAKVIQAATDFTNRYTMNYDAVAPVIKQVRQMPFANLFISYTAEMARIGKNLLMDAIEGQREIGGLSSHSRHNRMYAMLPLTALTLIPEMIEQSSEDALSPKDKADWEKAKKLMPAYARTRYRYVTGRDKKGQFRYIDFNPLVAADTFDQMGRAIANGDMKALAAVNPVISWDNTPLLNIAVEQIQGKDSHTFREFRGGMDRVASIANEMLPPWFPGGTEFGRWQRSHAVTSEGERGITNYKTGVRVTPSEFWTSYFGPLASGNLTPPGARVGSVNLQLLQKRVEQEVKSELANSTAYLNDVLKSDLPDAVKQKSIDKFKLTVATLREKYRAQLGVNE